MASENDFLVALEAQDEEKLITLIKAGWIPWDFQDVTQGNVVHMTVSNGFRRATILLLKRRPEYLNIPTIADGYFALHMAAIHNDPGLVEALAAEHATMDCADKRGYTPLHLAGMLGHAEAAAALLRVGASLNSRTLEGYSPMHVALIHGKDSVLELCLGQPNVDCDIQDNKGYTLLHYAVVQGTEQLVEQLLDAGANPNLGTRVQSFTPLHIAVKQNKLRVACALVSHGALLSAEDNDGKTPIGIAPAEWRKPLEESATQWHLMKLNTKLKGALSRLHKNTAATAGTATAETATAGTATAGRHQPKQTVSKPPSMTVSESLPATATSAMVAPVSAASGSAAATAATAPTPATLRPTPNLQSSSGTPMPSARTGLDTDSVGRFFTPVQSPSARMTAAVATTGAVSVITPDSASSQSQPVEPAQTVQQSVPKPHGFSLTTPKFIARGDRPMGTSPRSPRTPKKPFQRVAAAVTIDSTQTFSSTKPAALQDLQRAADSARLFDLASHAAVPPSAATSAQPARRSLPPVGAPESFLSDSDSDDSLEGIAWRGSDGTAVAFAVAQPSASGSVTAAISDGPLSLVARDIRVREGDRIRLPRSEWIDSDSDVD